MAEQNPGALWWDAFMRLARSHMSVSVRHPDALGDGPRIQSNADELAVVADQLFAEYEKRFDSRGMPTPGTGEA